MWDYTMPKETDPERDERRKKRREKKEKEQGPTFSTGVRRKKAIKYVSLFP